MQLEKKKQKTKTKKWVVWDLSLEDFEDRLLMRVWKKLKKPGYFTIQLIFAIIHRPHDTF